jgi:antitoxin component YwqK of YwqJK toxin-antitoxin module
MPASAKKAGKQKYVKRHADGTVWAIGSMLNGEPDGYFEWFRKDGTKLRSGYFKNGKQTGEWITYDAKGKPFKTTHMSRKESAKKTSRPKPKRQK